MESGRGDRGCRAPFRFGWAHAKGVSGNNPRYAFMMAGYSDYGVAMACPYCEAAGHASFGQTVVDGQLRWYCSILSCPAMGSVEQDGTGEAPADLRNRLLEACGTWSVSVDSPPKVRVLQIVKQALGLTQSADSAYLRGFPVLSVGTRAEADWLVAALAKDGIDAQTWNVRLDIKDPGTVPRADP